MKRAFQHLISTITDSWSIFVLVVFNILNINERHQIISIKLLKKFRFRDNIEFCLTNIGYGFPNALQVIRTEYIVIFVYSAMNIIITSTLFALFPFFTRLASHVLLFLLFVYTHYSKDDLTAAIYIFHILVFLYTIFGISRCFSQKKYSDEIADTIIGGSQKRTNPRFYIVCFGSFLVIALKVVILRFFDLKPSSFLSKMVYYYFIVVEVLVEAYKARCMHCLPYCSTTIPLFRNTYFLENIPLTLTSRAAALLKPFNFVLAALHGFLVFLGLNSTKFPIMKYFENNRSKLFYAAINSCPYFKASKDSRNLLWRGVLKEKLSNLSQVESLLPVVVLSCLIFKTFFGYILNFFRTSEMILIILTHYVFIYEMFHTFAAVDILAPYYSHISGMLEPKLCENEFIAYDSTEAGVATIDAIP